MSSTTESPITKVIFLQKIFRFAGRTPKDLVIINSVCKDFEETMQVHHTFNLVLYDNIIKKRKDEEDFLDRSVAFLSTAPGWGVARRDPAWIVYQWTVVNEHDEIQREQLKEFLLYQAKNYGNEILLRKNVSGEDPSTTHQLLRHILDSCDKLGIVKEVLEAARSDGNCITQAVSSKIFSDSFKFLIESCILHGVDMKTLLQKKDHLNRNCIMLAAGRQLPFASFKLLMESCVQHGVDMKEMLEEKDSYRDNCIMHAAGGGFDSEAFKLLIESCAQHGVDMKMMLEDKNNSEWHCLSLCTYFGLPVDSLKILIAHFPSNESFLTMLAHERNDRRAVDYAKTDEIKTLLRHPDCWKKCREWSVSQRAGQESGTRRQRE